MKRTNTSIRHLLTRAAAFAALTALPLCIHAQTTATWTGGGGNSLWNTPGNWDAGVPQEGTNALIGAGYTVEYSSPMAAASIGAVTNHGMLNVGAAGLTIETGVAGTSAISLGSNAVMKVNASGVVTVTNSGEISISTNALLSVNGGVLMSTNGVGIYGMLVGARTGRHNGGVLGLTNASVTLDRPLVIQGGPSGAGATASAVHLMGGALNSLGGTIISNSQDDATTRLIIDGNATANVGDLAIHRTHTSGGLILSNGVVNATSMLVGTGPSRAYVTVYGGALTNSGTFSLYNGSASGSSDRKAYFLQRGGTVVSTGAGGLVIATNSGTVTANQGGVYDINAGTLIAEGITLLADSTLANVSARVNLSGSGTIYLGSGGLVANLGGGGATATFAGTGGSLAAKAAWTGNADLTLSSGTTTIKTADAAGNPFDITLTGALTGAGTLAKTGGGKLVLQGISTHTGVININEGALALEGSGALPASTTIAVAAGATFDAGPALTLNAAQTLTGEGAVLNHVTLASSATIRVSDLLDTGTLTLANDLTENGGAINSFDVASPSSKDLLVVQGALNLSGVNTIQVSILPGASPGVYRLIDYGTLNGDVTVNLALAGANGYLSNNVADGAIDFVLSLSRPATNLVWVGDSTLNQWNTDGTANWKNGSTSFKFLPGDDVKFDSTGSVNPAVELVGTLTPHSLLVDATVDYTFGGAGLISGFTGLTKTNSGKLTVQTVNDYLGVTTLGGGTLSVSTLANGSMPCPIGAASSASSNLVFNSGTLEYLGATVTIDRGATLEAGGGAFSVTDPAAELRIAGQLTGAGKLTKRGAGLLDIRTVNDYVGGTDVLEGGLRLDRTSGATLGTNTLTLLGDASPVGFVFGGDAQVLANALFVMGTNNWITNSGNNTINNLTGNGILHLEGGGNTLTLQGELSAFNGTLAVETLPNLRLHPSTGSSNTIFNLGVGSGLLNNRNGGVTIHLGALVGGPSTGLQGASNDDGNDRPTIYAIGGRNLDSVFEGVISEASPRRQANIVKVGTGTWTLSGTSTYTASTTVREGVLALSGTGSFEYSTNLVIASPGILDVAGRFDSALNLGQSVAQTLGGDGTLRGSLVVGGSGTVSPGLSIGTLTVTNSVTLGGTVVMEINRAATPNNDRLVSPTITLGGTLLVTAVGPALQVGDSFDLFDGTLSGSFAGSVVLPSYYTWDISELEITGTVRVTGALPPPSLAVALSGADLVLSAANGLPNGPLLILTSTNVALPLNQWSPIETNVFDGTGNFTLTTPLDLATPQRFYLLQAN